MSRSINAAGQGCRRAAAARGPLPMRGDVVDFKDVVKAKIGSMSPDALAATELRRQTREAERQRHLTIQATLTSAGGETETREVALHIDQPPTPGADDVLKLTQGQAFHESVILTPAVYRLIAGGSDAPADKAKAPQRFIVNEGGSAFHRICVDRDDLLRFMIDHRPQEAALASRLVAEESRGASLRLSAPARAQAFLDYWSNAKLQRRIQAAATKAQSRPVHLLARANRVSLWLTLEDFLEAPGVLNSQLAAAIVSPRPIKLQPNAALSASSGPTPDCLAYLNHTQGPGPVRALVLDLTIIEQTLATLGADERDDALKLFERLIDRSGATDRLRGRASGVSAMMPRHAIIGAPAARRA